MFTSSGHLTLLRRTRSSRYSTDTPAREPTDHTERAVGERQVSRRGRGHGPGPEEPTTHEGRVDHSREGRRPRDDEETSRERQAKVDDRRQRPAPEYRRQDEAVAEDQTSLIAERPV